MFYIYMAKFLSFFLLPMYISMFFSTKEKSSKSSHCYVGPKIE